MANKSTLRARRSIRVTVTTSGGEVVEHLEKLAPVLEGDADFPGRWRAIKTAFSLESFARPRVAITGHDQPWHRGTQVEVGTSISSKRCSIRLTR
jgi:hypothetical protein